MTLRNVAPMAQDVGVKQDSHLHIHTCQVYLLALQASVVVLLDIYRVDQASSSWAKKLKHPSSLL